MAHAPIGILLLNFVLQLFRRCQFAFSPVETQPSFVRVRVLHGLAPARHLGRGQQLRVGGVDDLAVGWTGCAFEIGENILFEGLDRGGHVCFIDGAIGDEPAQTLRLLGREIPGLARVLEQVVQPRPAEDSYFGERRRVHEEVVSFFFELLSELDFSLDEPLDSEDFESDPFEPDLDLEGALDDLDFERLSFL